MRLVIEIDVGDKCQSTFGLLLGCCATWSIQVMLCFLFSSYSSEQSTKAKTQKELLKTLQELKAHLPSEKRVKGKSSVLTTLKYALKSIKQVKGNKV